MTKQQTDAQNMAYEVIRQLREHGGYIKGYGDKMHRVMCADHSPLMNIKNDIVECLKFNGIIERYELIWHTTDKMREVIFSDQLIIEGAVITKKQKR
jgi:hypothetical protein